MVVAPCPSEVVNIGPETLSSHGVDAHPKICRKNGVLLLESFEDRSDRLGIVNETAYMIDLVIRENLLSQYLQMPCFSVAKMPCRVCPGRRAIASYRRFAKSRLSRASFLYPFLLKEQQDQLVSFKCRYSSSLDLATRASTSRVSSYRLSEGKPLKQGYN